MAQKSANQAAAEAKREATAARKEAARAKTEAAKARVSRFGSGHAAGFVDFIRQQGVVGLAVGLAIGAAAGASVKAIVEGFVTPLVRLIVGTESRFESAVWHVKIGTHQADFAWGAVISSLITLLATALVIYAVVHGAKLDRLDKKKQ